MKAKLSLLPLLALTSTRIGALGAQALPTTQPAYLTIVREEVKLGRGAEHTRIEAGWPAAFAKAKSPSSYLALASLTGQDEVWFTIPFASNAAVAEEFKRQDADPVLSAELARLARADAEVLTGHTVVQAVARPDLTTGAFPDVAKQRFWQITTFRVKPGHRPDFEAAAKAYGAAAQRAEPKTSYRVYELIAGAPGPTFFIFSSVESYGQFDDLTEVLGGGACQLGDQPLPARSGDELRVAGDAGAGSRVLDPEEAGRARDHATVRRRGPWEDTMRTTALLRKRAEGWKIVHWHESDEHFDAVMGQVFGARR